LGRTLGEISFRGNIVNGKKYLVETLEETLLGKTTLGETSLGEMSFRGNAVRGIGTIPKSTDLIMHCLDQGCQIFYVFSIFHSFFHFNTMRQVCKIS
jgi:hypothetical protein